MRTLPLAHLISLGLSITLSKPQVLTLAPKILPSRVPCCFSSPLIAWFPRMGIPAPAELVFRLLTLLCSCPGYLFWVPPLKSHPSLSPAPHFLLQQEDFWTPQPAEMDLISSWCQRSWSSVHTSGIHRVSFVSFSPARLQVPGDQGDWHVLRVMSHGAGTR